ncbi:MAG TPA: thiamine pyrophosphokinase [Alphaproteobacteria bacterium]|nr:thiamine pyrophosphokinase [Alphaproteobacteria bacterium]HQS94417.1 thiamine pyrophosphokinase [Alphaproteobacteria bacterium]
MTPQGKIYFLTCFVICCLLSWKINAVNDFLIIANGPFEAEEVIRKHLPHKTIVALDGAALHLYERKITPHYILGDFDSLQEIHEKEESLDSFNFRQVNHHFLSKSPPRDDDLQFEEYAVDFRCDWRPDPLNITYVRAFSQNYTDLEKGIKFCALKGANTIIIVNSLGGARTDHSFGAYSILAEHHGNPYKIQLETPQEIIKFVKDETVAFKGTPGAKFGLFGFPEATVSSKGLQWDMRDFLLKLGGSKSLGNILKETEVTLHIRGAALMMRPNY